MITFRRYKDIKSIKNNSYCRALPRTAAHSLEYKTKFGKNARSSQLLRGTLFKPRHSKLNHKPSRAL